jgi:hypothetical protein
MSRKLIAILSVLVVLSLMTTAVFAGFKGRNIDFSLGGSVIVTGEISGGDKDPVVVTIFMSAPSADVICTNKGNPDNIVPGQNPGEVVAEADFTLEGNTDGNVENGFTKFKFVVPDPTLTGTEAGCPNDNWTAKLFPDWDYAEFIIKVKDADPEEVLFEQKYDCEIKDKDTEPSLSCTPQTN